MDSLVNRRRHGGRAGNTRRDAKGALRQRPWELTRMRDPFVEPLDDDGVRAIHDGAMTILRDIGVRFLNDEALKIFAEAGQRVDEGIVRLDPDWVAEMVSRAPSEFTLTPRNADRALHVGGRSIAFGNVSSPPAYWSLATGKVVGSFARATELLKLTQAFECIHFAGGYPVEPVDLHPATRHLDMLQAKLTLTDKVPHAYSLGAARIEDALAMIRIAGGWSEAEFRATPRMFTNINSTSPLKHDHPMIDGCLRCIRAGQAVVVTPFTLAGAMAPVTMAGAVALSIAEALSGIALFQHVAPGCACVLGTFTSNVDMASGAPAFGTPEYVRATQMTGQMARFYGLPLRSSGVCTANVPDAQSTWETTASLWAALQSGSNLVYHAAGWLEGGLIASPEKFVIDCEIINQFQRLMDDALVSTAPEDIAVAAVAAVGHDGHYFGADHTQARYETAFYRPFLSDWRNYEAWEKDGAVWTPERAARIAGRMLDAFEAPPLDAAIAEELSDFVARRKAEGGAPTDF